MELLPPTLMGEAHVDSMGASGLGTGEQALEAPSMRGWEHEGLSSPTQVPPLMWLQCQSCPNTQHWLPNSGRS